MIERGTRFFERVEDTGAFRKRTTRITTRRDSLERRADKNLSANGCRR